MKLKQCHPTQRPGPDEFNAKFYQTFNDELTKILLKLVIEIEREGILHSSIYEAGIILIPKLNKDTMQKENCKPSC
jgi:hypothetical protein